MRTIRTARIAFVSLGAHPFRALLAALGVVFGVGAVVAMMAISAGARREALRQIEALGIDNIVVRSIKPESGKSASAGSGSSAIAAYGITDGDVRHIRNTFRNVRAVLPIRYIRKDIYRDGIKTDARQVAVPPEFFRIAKTRLVEGGGRYFTKGDAERLKAVAVLGREAARSLFGYKPALGEVVSVGGATFRVVGILENVHGIKLAGELDLDKLVYVPLSTAESLYGKLQFTFSSGTFERTQVDVDYLYIVVKKVEAIDDTVARLKSYLARTHDEPDYDILVPYDLLRQRAATQRIFTIVMASIAAISLLVGGIGIMNIMLANIYERTREIGTRRALGAKRRDILIQFLMESITLTAAGGIVGVLLGIGLSEAVSAYASMPTTVSWISVSVSLVVSVATGVVFGTYPAWKAANLSPIEALRRE